MRFPWRLERRLNNWPAGCAHCLDRSILLSPNSVFLVVRTSRFLGYTLTRSEHGRTRSGHGRYSSSLMTDWTLIVLHPLSPAMISQCGCLRCSRHSSAHVPSSALSSSPITHGHRQESVSPWVSDYHRSSCDRCLVSTSWSTACRGHELPGRTLHPDQVR